MDIKKIILKLTSTQIAIMCILSLSAFVSCKKYSSYQEAARAYDFEAAHNFIDEMNNTSEPLKRMNYKEWERRKEEAFDYVFNAEAMYLCSRGDLESINRLTFLLSDIPVKGVAIPEGTEYESEHDFDFDRLENHSMYIEYASKYNLKCSNLIDLAISNHNIAIVEKVLPLFKSVPNPFKVDSKEVAYNQGGRVVLSTKYRLQKMDYTDIAKKQAIDKVNKAIRDGVFPNISKEY